MGFSSYLGADSHARLQISRQALVTKIGLGKKDCRGMRLLPEPENEAHFCDVLKEGWVATRAPGSEVQLLGWHWQTAWHNSIIIY